MRLLFELDTKDYDLNGVAFIRHSARCIHIKNGLVAMVHSVKYDYYKFPGGGIEKDESAENAMIRETLEEAGLVVIPESVKEYGYVHRIQKRDHADADYLVQDNYYYLCDVEEGVQAQILDDYEADERFTLEFVEPDKAILANRKVIHGPNGQAMRNQELEREARVLELLKEEGYFN